MAPDTNDWNEYRRLLLSWHDDEVRERREVKLALEIYQTANQKEHQEIMKQLTTLTTEKEQTRRWVGPVMTAIVSGVVALAVTACAKTLGF